MLKGDQLKRFVSRYSGEYKGRLTPSRLLTSSSGVRGASSVDAGLNKMGATPTGAKGSLGSAKRVLSFNDEK